jgi:hypothetical protein
MEATLNRKARRKSKQPRVRLSWSARMALLESEATVRSMPARRRRDLLAECKAMQKRLIRECCTVVWCEDVWTSCTEIEYPPPAENTPMRKCRCPACRKAGKFWPGHYVGAGGLTFECWLERFKYSHLIPGTIGNVVRKADL